MWRTVLAVVLPLISAWGSSDQSSWDVLYKSLASPNPDHRRQALTALGAIGPANDRAVKLIENALRDDKDTLVRQTAAAVLGQMEARQAVPLLRQALDDKDEVAFTAAKALADMGDYSGRGVFIDVVTGERKDAPGLVTAKLRQAKSTMRHPDQLALMGAREASGVLLGPASMGIVVAEEVFKDKTSAGRALATSYLAKEPDPYAVTLLEWALSDSNHGVRAMAAKGLADRGNGASIAKLQPLLADEHTAVRTMAAAAIIRIQEQGATP